MRRGLLLGIVWPQRPKLPRRLLSEFMKMTPEEFQAAFRKAALAEIRAGIKAFNESSKGAVAIDDGSDFGLTITDVEPKIREPLQS